MAVLRFLTAVTLSVWVGGLIALALAAPVLFLVLEGQAPAAGRELAGAAFGAIFRHFQSAAWLCGGLLLALLVARAAIGPRPRRLAVRLWIVLGMLAVSIATTLMIIPRIDRLRAQASGSIAGLPIEDPRRTSFTRLHRLSNGLMVLTIGAGLVLLWFETTDAG